MKARYKCTSCEQSYTGVWLDKAKQPKHFEKGFCAACWEVILKTQQMHVRREQNLLEQRRKLDRARNQGLVVT